MGYKLSGLVHLPFRQGVEMYIFSIGEHIWEGGLAELVYKNFDAVAKSIGPNAIIVGALNEEFHGEVVRQYLGKNYHELQNELPALLITDAHPSELNDESLRLLIPLRTAQSHYEVIDKFFEDLAAFARGENSNLLAALDSAPPKDEIADEVVKINIPIIPGIVAVNLNAAVNHLRAWRERAKDGGGGVGA